MVGCCLLAFYLHSTVDSVVAIVASHELEPDLRMAAVGTTRNLRLPYPRILCLKNVEEVSPLSQLRGKWQISQSDALKIIG